MDGIGKSFIDKTVTDDELLQAIGEILDMSINSTKPALEALASRLYCSSLC